MTDTDKPRWPMTPMSTGDPEAADPPRPSTVPRDNPPADTSDERSADEDELPGGSGTAGPATPEKQQAGSYARDAEQDPARERHGRDDAE
jgi:hypothetical protein